MFTTIRSDLHRQHFPDGELSGGQLVRPYECPERWDYIIERLQQQGHTDCHDPSVDDAFTVDLAAQVHTAPYLAFLQQAWPQWQQAGFAGEAIPTVFPARRMQQREPEFIDGKLGYYAMAIETAITAGTWTAAISSAACAIDAQQRAGNGATAVFSLCRPPGHHAASDLYGGYCFLNNAAIAAQGFRNQGLARVAILDVDFHHGNGTQDIFYARDDVLFLSLHGEPQQAFPHFLGYADEIGQDQGAGFNANFPLPEGTPFGPWNDALSAALQRVREYAAEALVISLGVDTYFDDPISFFKLESDDFIRYGERIGRLGRELDIPIVFIMEGGYAVREIGINTVNVLDGYLSQR